LTFAGREDMQMVTLIERNLGKKMARQAFTALPGDTLEAAESRPMRQQRPAARASQRPSSQPARRKSTGNGGAARQGAKPRARAVPFDFDVRSLSAGSGRKERRTNAG
jgi:hypothetical protein